MIPAKHQILYWLIVLSVVTSALGVNDDLFNYGTSFIDENGRNSYPQDEWDAVSCSDVDVCSGYPHKYPFGHFSLEGESNCRWCPELDESINCGLHRQSPINLLRNRSVKGHPREKDCPDWHYFAFWRDSCNFEDIKGNFAIERHALQIHIPTLPNGDIDCIKDNQRLYPRLDSSAGFPDNWHMARIDISVPSQHVQEGNQYAAEVTLAHFYEIEHFKNHLGHIAIFLQDYEDAGSWTYLDKMICQWRIEEEKVREACGLPPAEPYGRCRLFRNQEPSDEWLVEAGIKFAEDSFTASPLPSDVVQEPAAGPTTSFPSGTATQSPTNVESTILPTVLSSTVSPTDDGLLGDSIPTIPLPSPVKQPVTSPVVLQPIPPSSNSPVPSTTNAPPTFFPTTDGTGTTLPPSTIFPSIGDTTFQPTTLLPSIGDTTFQPTTLLPSMGDTTSQAEGGSTGDSDFEIPPAIRCTGGINMARLCEGSKPCCESTRSDTNFCWESYEVLGPALASACYHCCDTPKIVGPATPPKPNLAKTITCSELDNPHRMCKENSCCSDPTQSSDFCVLQRQKLGVQMVEACYYCCSEPQDYQANSRKRSLLRGDGEDKLPEGARIVEAMGKRFLLRKENHEAKKEGDQFEAVYEEYKKRSLQSIHAIDYEDIDWYAYEWMLKVGTEYYFRYEGTMLTPPCWETVHWRVLKDPIRVHKRQIKELNRLLAWRLNPDTCQVDTAGVLSNDGNSVAVNRELQYNTNIHRKVFCECNDWVSKYEADQAWCAGYEEEGNYERLYDRPYSFDTDGEWLPS